MKTVIIADLHGKSTWKLIVNTENPDKVIFLGDYFDSFDLSTEEQCNNFLDIVEYKRKNPEKEIVMLIGNHDYHYLPGINTEGTSGFQKLGQYVIRPIIEKNIDCLTMCHIHGNLLCTHAGVGLTWLEKHGWTADQRIDEFINDLYQYKPLAFEFDGWNGYGDDMGQTPIWIRPRSLMKDAKELKKDYVQVVGHTPQNQVDREGKATGGRYYFMDTMDSTGEYMILEDENMSFKSLWRN